MSNRDVEILLVDDDTAVRVISTRILSTAGLSIEAVADGETALDLLRRGRRFDVIVSDLVMPNMDGMELLRRVRELDLDVPVIVMTGQGTLESAILAMEYGGFRYLQKPVENATLVQVVRDAAAHHRLLLLKRKALEICEAGGDWLVDLDELDDKYSRALERLWVAYHRSSAGRRDACSATRRWFAPTRATCRRQAYCSTPPSAWGACRS